MKRYDLVVLGAGPGGYVAAIRASQLGLATAIVERRFWGGVCLNVGCIPSKALLRNAELVRLLRGQAQSFGIHASGLSFDYGAAYARSREVADGRARGVRYLLRKNRVEQYEGEGRFLDPNTLEVALAGGATERIVFDHAIIATGAEPKRLPGAPRDARIVTYEGQILSEALPETLLIVGGGPIGVEFATLASAYGTRVTLIEALPRLLPGEDEEAALIVRRELARSGVRVLTEARVEQLVALDTSVRVTLQSQEGSEAVDVERVLEAIGFRAKSRGFGLEESGVELRPDGAVVTDPWLQTTVPHLYAIGDVTGRSMLAHAAEAQALVAVEALAGLDIDPFEEASVPRVTFSHPEVASFGPTETEARRRGLAVEAAAFPLQANGKAQGLGEPLGFVKLLAEPAGHRLIGATLVGHGVGELLPELTLAARQGLAADAVARNIHAHPTLAEAVKDAAHGLAGGFINR